MKNKKMIGLIIVVIVILLIGVFVISNLEDIKISISSDKTVDVKAYILDESGEFIVYVANKNSTELKNLLISAVYYDEKGDKIKDTSAYISSIKPKSDYATTVELPEDENEEEYLPAKIELSVKQESLPDNNIEVLENYSDKVETSYNLNDYKSVKVTLKNNSGMILDDVNAVALFMKDNKIIQMVNISSYLDVNEAYDEEIEIPTYYNENKDAADIIDYDSIKIIVNSATHDIENVEDDEETTEEEVQVEE